MYGERNNCRKLLRNAHYGKARTSNSNYHFIDFANGTRPIENDCQWISISSTDMMQDKEIQIKDVLVLNERIFWICDAWPLNNSYKMFVIYISYLSVHMVIMNMDLYDAMGDLQLMVENIINNTIITTTYLMLFLLRFSKLMKSAVAMVKRELAEDDFRNNDERQLYLSYNIICDNFGRYAVRTTAVIVVMLYSTPMLKLLKSGSGDGNSSRIYELPIRVRPFLNFDNGLRNYFLVYAYELPVMGTGIFHIGSISLLLNLVLHVCGKFSILSYRIQNIVEDSQDSFQLKVKELVERHVELVSVANTINSALQFILALELLQTSIRMAVLLYTILMLRDDQVMEIFTYSLYVMIVTSMLYLYSFIGEQLQTESTKVNDAYYKANWLKLSTRDQKLLLYCMCNGRKTLSLTAGKFYSFSLFGFIKIMKSCFGFVSLLRAVV